MFENIKKNIRSIVNFNEEDLTIFLSCLEPKAIKKHDFFVREGELCNYVAFINKGSVRITYNKDGEEQVGGFFVKGDWVSEYGSFLGRQPSVYSINAIENTELFLLNYDKMQQLYDRGKPFERFGRIVAEQLFLITVERQISFLLQTPEERYRKLLEDQPHLFNLVSLKQIASFLGIKPESLSRIRKRINKAS
jgi:CRP-like cAMP-binding protein